MALPPAATKYKFEGIGKASAVATMTALSTTGLAGLTQGVWGKLLFWGLTQFYSILASMGLVVANIGVDYVKTLIEKGDFDGTWDRVFKVINERKGTLTKEEGDALDNQVIAAHNRFGTFGKLRDH